MALQWHGAAQWDIAAWHEPVNGRWHVNRWKSNLLGAKRMESDVSISFRVSFLKAVSECLSSHSFGLLLLSME